MVTDQWQQQQPCPLCAMWITTHKWMASAAELGSSVPLGCRSPADLRDMLQIQGGGGGGLAGHSVANQRERSRR
jgi:hypothetical protein